MRKMAELDNEERPKEEGGQVNEAPVVEEGEKVAPADDVEME